jgi:hypothetical protein
LQLKNIYGVVLSQKISPELLVISRNSDLSLLDTIITFQSPPTSEDQLRLESNGCIWKKSFKIINAAQVLIPSSQLEEIASLERISLISENANSRAMG